MDKHKYNFYTLDFFNSNWISFNNPDKIKQNLCIHHRSSSFLVTKSVPSPSFIELFSHLFTQTTIISDEDARLLNERQTQSGTHTHVLINFLMYEIIMALTTSPSYLVTIDSRIGKVFRAPISSYFCSHIAFKSWVLARSAKDSYSANKTNQFTFEIKYIQTSRRASQWHTQNKIFRGYKCIKYEMLNVFLPCILVMWNGATVRECRSTVILKITIFKSHTNQMIFSKYQNK